MSLFWADDKYSAAKEVIRIIILVGVSLSISVAYTLPERASIFATCTGFFLFWGIFEAIRTGRFLTTDLQSGRFGDVGVIGKAGKSRQALNSVVFILCVAYLVESNTLQETVAIPLVVLAMFLLALTRTRLTLWAGFIASLVWTTASLYHPGYAVSWVVWLIPPALPLIVTFVLYSPRLIPPPPSKNPRYKPSVFASFLHLGRDTSDTRHLNTRLPIWRYTLSVQRGVRTRLIGKGFGSFWTPARIEEDRLTLPNAHSIYLQLYGDIGLIGLGLFLTLCFTTIGTAFDLPLPHGFFVISIVVFAMLHGVLESSFVFTNFEAFLLITTILGTALDSAN